MNCNNPLLPIVKIVLLVLMSCILSPAEVGAEAVQAQRWEITADKLTRFEDPPSIIAEGNVVLEKSEKITKRKKTKEKMDWSSLLEEPSNKKTRAEPVELEEKKEKMVITTKILEETPNKETAAEPVALGEQTTKIVTTAKGLEKTSNEETTAEPVALKEKKEKMVTKTKVTATIKADWMVYDLDLGSVKARGNVLIDIGPDQLMAEKGVINLNRETGTFTNASIIREYKDMHFEGRVIEKTGDLTYHIEDGWLITCKLKKDETPPWSFGVAEADITENGYALLKHAVFRIKGVPVLYTPIMALPVKNSRQTGFLFPTISNSDRDGVGIEFPFFLNLSANSDITLYPQYMSERGFMSGLEMRYVLDQDSKGGFMVNYLHDKLSDINDPDNFDYFDGGDYTHTNQNRYWIRGKVDQDFGEWTTRLDLDIVSDLDYLTEFNSGLTGFAMTDDRFSDVFGRGFQNKTEEKRENTLRALRSWGNGISLQANLIGIDDLRVDKTSPTPLWKLPSIDFDGLIPIYDTDADFSWKTNYVYYWRDKGVQASRVDLFPRISMGIPLSDYLETTLGAGIRDTFYIIQGNDDPEWTNTSSTENRFLGDFKAEIGTTLIRDFALSSGTLTEFSHTFRPYVDYRYVSDVDQEDLPQFDGVDDVGDQNIVTYGLDNFFTLRGEKHDEEYDRDYGYLKIKQGYDIRSSESNTPLTPINMRLAYYPLEDLRFEYRTDLDVYGDNFLKHTVENEYQNSRGDLFSLDYLYNKNVDEEEDEITSSIKAAARVGLFYYFTVGYSIERSIEDQKTVEENINLVYQPSCWSLELASNYTPGNQKITLMFRLANIGNPFGMVMPGL